MNLILVQPHQSSHIYLVEQNTYKTPQIADHGYILWLGQITYRDYGDNLLNANVIREAYLGASV